MYCLFCLFPSFQPGLWAFMARLLCFHFYQLSFLYFLCYNCGCILLGPESGYLMIFLLYHSHLSYVILPHSAIEFSCTLTYLYDGFETTKVVINSSTSWRQLHQGRRYLAG
jgi:hypothetical protein